MVWGGGSEDGGGAVGGWTAVGGVAELEVQEGGDVHDVIDGWRAGGFEGLDEPGRAGADRAALDDVNGEGGAGLGDGVVEGEGVGARASGEVRLRQNPRRGSR